MVCLRCEMILESELKKMKIPYSNLVLGEATLNEELSEEKFEALDLALKKYGLELIRDRRSNLIERIKTLIIGRIRNPKEDLKEKFSDYLSRELNYDYKYLSNLFSEVRGSTIEKYIIAQKIEFVKELLVYNELNLSEIAWKLNYSSVQHLSNQFKKTTGLTPTFFKKISEKRRESLNNL